MGPLAPGEASLRPQAGGLADEVSAQFSTDPGDASLTDVRVEQEVLCNDSSIPDLTCVDGLPESQDACMSDQAHIRERQSDLRRLGETLISWLSAYGSRRSNSQRLSRLCRLGVVTWVGAPMSLRVRRNTLRYQYIKPGTPQKGEKCRALGDEDEELHSEEDHRKNTDVEYKVEFSVVAEATHSYLVP